MNRWLQRKALHLYIQWHWRCIERGEKRVTKWLDAGEPFSSSRLGKMYGRISQHCVKEMAAANRDEKLTGMVRAGDSKSIKALSNF